MNLPFTVDQFLSVFEQYNLAVWPMQIALNLLALVIIVMTIKQISGAEKIIAGVLAFFWIWVGVVYHLMFFSSINPAARVFGALNILQGLVFLYFGVFRPRLIFTFRTDVYGITGALFVLYGLVIYPIIGYALGHVYPKSPTFGLPCPTTIFTFGIFLWTKAKMPKTVIIIPVLWSVIGFSAALTMGIREDIGLLVAGVGGTLLIIIRDKKGAGKQEELRAAA